MTALEGQPPLVASYLAQLNKGLAPLPAAEREDIVREIASNLDEGLAAGAAVEALLERLGPAHAVAAAMVEERLITVDQRRSSDELIRIVAKAAFRPFLGAIAGWLAMMELNTAYLYWGWLQEHPLTWRMLVGLSILQLPAILVVCLPVATLFAGLIGVPEIARSLSTPTFRSVLPKVSAALLAFGVFASGVAFAINDWVVIPANRATVQLQRQILGMEAVTVRSPQEQTLAELRARIADNTRRYTHTGPSSTLPDAWGVELAQLRFHYHLKLSLPALCLSLAALGLSLGLLFASRRPLWWPLVTGFGLLIIMAQYIVYVLSRGMVEGATFWGNWPALAAWMWNGTSLGLALLLGGLAYLKLRRAGHA